MEIRPTIETEIKSTRMMTYVAESGSTTVIDTNRNRKRTPQSPNSAQSPDSYAHNLSNTMSQ